MFFNDAIYHVVNATRTGSPIHQGRNTEVNPLIHFFMDEGYVTYQSTALRRMIDRSPMVGPKAVYSLYRLIDDMKDYQSFFTRKNIFEASGLNPDIETRRREMEALISGHPPGQPIWTPRHLVTFQEEALHKSIDHLSGASAAHRQDDDRVPESLFERLLDKLNDESLITLKDYVDKYIAHTATPESIQHAGANIQITLSKIRKAQEIICRTYNYLAQHLICGAGTFSLATVAFNLFDHLENPMIRIDQKDALQEIWDKNETEIKDWKSWNDI